MVSTFYPKTFKCYIFITNYYFINKYFFAFFITSSSDKNFNRISLVSRTSFADIGFEIRLPF